MAGVESGIMLVATNVNAAAFLRDVRAAKLGPPPRKIVGVPTLMLVYEHQSFQSATHVAITAGNNFINSGVLGVQRAVNRGASHGHILRLERFPLDADQRP